VEILRHDLQANLPCLCDKVRDQAGLLRKLTRVLQAADFAIEPSGHVSAPLVRPVRHRLSASPQRYKTGRKFSRTRGAHRRASSGG
jgi:hypothetical protein